MKLNFSMKSLALVSVLSFGFIAPVFADETPLEEEMSVMGKSLKGLRRAKTTEDKVKLIQAAQLATLKSLEYLPMIFKDIKDDAEKAKATADYKMMVGQSYVKFCQLELAFLEGNDEAADELLSEIKDLRKAGHQKYIED